MSESSSERRDPKIIEAVAPRPPEIADELGFKEEARLRSAEQAAFYRTKYIGRLTQEIETAERKLTTLEAENKGHLRTEVERDSLLFVQKWRRYVAAIVTILLAVGSSLQAATNGAVTQGTGWALIILGGALSLGMATINPKKPD